MPDMVGVDLLVVPTIRFRLRYMFATLSHARRQVVHFNVTANLTAEWTAQQIVQMFPWAPFPGIFFETATVSTAIRFTAAFNRWAQKKWLRHTLVLGKIPASNGSTEVFAEGAPTSSLSLANAICAEYSGPISRITTTTENIWASVKKHRWAPYLKSSISVRETG